MGRPRRGDRPKNETILEAAMGLFLRQGYAATSMSQLAQQAGVSKRTLYTSFKNKESLFAAVVQSLAEDVIPHGEVDQTFEGTPRRVLTCFGAALLRRLCSGNGQALFRLVVAEGGRNAELRAVFFERAMTPVLGQLEAYLRKCHKSGALRVPRPKTAARHFVGMLKQVAFWPLLVATEEEHTAPDKAVRDAVRTFLRAHMAER